MTAQLTDAQYLGTKSEREAISLREGVKSMKEQWGREMRTLREEMKLTVEKGKKEREEVVSGQTRSRVQCMLTT
jgi:hypothetical protein